MFFIYVVSSVTHNLNLKMWKGNECVAGNLPLRNTPPPLCKEGWCVGLGHEERIRVRVGGIIWSILKGCAIEKMRLETNI